MEHHTSRLKNLDPETRALQAKIKTAEQQHTEVMQRRLTMNSVGKTVNGRDINKVPSVLYEKLRKQSIASGNAKESIRDQMEKLRGSMEELAYSTLQRGGTNNSPKNLFLDSTSRLGKLRSTIQTDGTNSRNSVNKIRMDLNTQS